MTDPQTPASEPRTKSALGSEAETEGQRRRSGLLAFLNSPFGLFLLSSVVIAGLGRLYADYQNSQSALRAKRELLGELLTEFDYRVTQAAYLSRDVEGVEDVTEVNSCVFLWRLVVGDREYRPAVPSMREVHWLGLISRARTVTGLPSIQAERAVLKLQFDTDGGRCSKPMKPSRQIAILARYSESLHKELERLD